MFIVCATNLCKVRTYERDGSTVYLLTTEAMAICCIVAMIGYWTLVQKGYLHASVLSLYAPSDLHTLSSPLQEMDFSCLEGEPENLGGMLLTSLGWACSEECC